MRTVLIASLRTHTRRYVAAVVAVMIAVGFVLVTNALASATKSGLSAGVEQAYRGGDLVIGQEYGLAQDGDLAASAALAQRRGDAVSVIASGWVPVTHDGSTLGSRVPVGTVSTDPRLLAQRVVDGRQPRQADEALVSATEAEQRSIALGDRLTLGSGSSRTVVRVVGTAASSSYLSADLYVPWEVLETQAGTVPDSVVYDVRRGEVEDRAAQLRRTVESTVQTQSDYVDQRVTMVNQGVDVVSYLLLLFAAVAGFVAVLVIANTFTILYAQRVGDLALLRCVGATGRQVLRSVRTEALVLALAAASLGVVGGAAAGYGITAVVRAVAGAQRIGAVDLSPSWLGAAFVGGVVTTVGAAWWPSRAVTRVSPLAALRPSEDVGLGDRAGRIRVGLGCFVLLSSSAGLALAVHGRTVPLMLMSGMASFVGVLLLGPVLVPAALRVAGRLLGPLGPSVRLASANAVRNPRRSATTTASLLVGVTLTTAMLTGMASARSAVNSEMDGQHPVDVAVVGTATLPSSLVQDVAATPGIRRTVAVDGVVAPLGDLGRVPMLAPFAAAIGLTRDTSAVRVASNEVLVPTIVAAQSDVAVPDQVVVETPQGRLRLDVRLVGAEWGDAVLVAPATLAKLGRAAPLAVWAEAEDGADAGALGRAVSTVTGGSDPQVEVTNALEDRAWVQTQLDVLLWAVLGLLGVGIAIALVGIANTLGLSVLERRREHALLRALGLTRRQLRRVLAAEGVLLALVAAVFGTAVGTTYGWIGVQTMVRSVVAEVPLVFPWAALAAVVVGAGLAGLAACVLPARRASRVAPAAGLTAD